MLNTHVSWVPKKNTWYLLEGDFTAPSGNSSICRSGAQLLKDDVYGSGKNATNSVLGDLTGNDD